MAAEAKATTAVAPAPEPEQPTADAVEEKMHTISSPAAWIDFALWLEPFIKTADKAREPFGSQHHMIMWQLRQQFKQNHEKLQKAEKGGAEHQKIEADLKRNAQKIGSLYVVAYV
jgi:hypothetical protein